MSLSEVLSVYARVILEFLFELYVFCVLVTRKLERSRLFWLRAFGGLAVVAGLAFGVAWFYALFGFTVWGRVLVYIVLFLAVCLHLRLCFEESFSVILFCGSLAYAAQNLTYKLFLFLWGMGEQARLYDNWNDLFELYYRLIYYGFFVLAAAAAYFLFIRPLISRLPNRQLNFRMLTISVVVLAVTVLLCSVEDIFFSFLSDFREGRFEEFTYFVLWQTGNLFSVVCCGVVLLLISRTLEQSDLQREVDYLQYAIRQSKQQYEISKDTIELINVKCHDIKYKINELLARHANISEDAVSDLNESISIYDTKVETGNELLDVLLTEKSLYCEQNGITFSCMAHGEKLSFLESGDLYCLFGNIVDNALEAVKALPEREKRIINLVVKTKNDLLIVQEDNYFGGEISFRDGLPVTTKADSDYHGFGTRSIRMIARKYGGELTTSVTGDIFHLNIIFSIEKAENRQIK